MTDDRTLDRVARSWLEEGPTRAPDRPVEAALARIQTTPQERDLRLPWRYRQMNSSLKLAVGAAAVAVAAILVVNVLPKSPGPGIGTPPPSASATPAPKVLAVGPLSAGAYTTAGPVPMSLTVPQGWEGIVVGSTVTVLGRDGAFLGFWIVGDAQRDPCGLGGVADTDVGPTVADLAAALAAVPGFETTDPVARSVDGIDGQYVELIGPLAGCAEPEPELWLTPGGSCRCMDGTVERNRIWIVDVGGSRLAVDALEIPASEGVTGTSEAVLAEIQAMVDSIQFQP